MQYVIKVFYSPANATLSNGPFLYATGIATLILSTFFLVIEGMQLYQLRLHYFLEWENYLQMFTFWGTIAFVAAQLVARTTAVWQFGAVVFTCCWWKLILTLRDCPIFGIGGYITLLGVIIWRYLKLAPLPILLMASFGFPFYMLVAEVMLIHFSANA